MSFARTVTKSGIMLLHHPDDAGWQILEEDRAIEQAGEINRELFRATGILEVVNQGPILAGLLWQPPDRGQAPRLWTFGSATSLLAVGNVEGLRPVAGPSWSQVREMVPRDLVTPYNLLYPVGWSFSTFRGASFDGINPVSVPGFLGLVAPHWAGGSLRGSWVWDLDDDSKLDEDRMALLQSFLRVYLRPAGGIFGTNTESGGLALQLGMARGDLCGLGMVADDILPGKLATVAGGRPQVLAALTFRVGGPVHVGRPKDQHQLGVSRDGEPIHPVHTSTKQIFQRPDGSGDSPQRDSGAWVPCPTGPVLVEAFWRHDAEALHTWSDGTKQRLGAGEWRIQSSSYVTLIPRRRPDPPPTPPPPPKPKPEPIPPPPLPPPPSGDPPPVFPEPQDQPRPGGDVFGPPIGPEVSGPGDFDPEDPGVLLEPEDEPDPVVSSPEPIFTRRVGGELDVQQKVSGGRSLAGMMTELALPGLVFRAPRLSKLAPDLRNLDRPATHEEMLEWALQMIVGGMAAYGQQLDGQAVRETQQGSEAARHDHPGGYGRGAVALMPGQIGPENSEDASAVKSRFTLHAAPGARIGWGKPNLEEGGPAPAFVTEYDEDTDELRLLHINESRVESLIASMPSTGPCRDWLFGDGQDGDGEFASDDALTGDHALYYETLSLEPGVSVETGGRLVFVRQTLTLAENSRLHCDGGPGDHGAEGGAGGAAPGSSYYGVGFAGGDGGAAVLGVPENGDAGSGGSASLGGSGATGGTASTGVVIATGGAGGTATAATHTPRTAAQLADGRDRDVTLFKGGASGGGGGAAISSGAGNAIAGGGGGSGGMNVIFARRLVLDSSAVISADGGAGGNGEVSGFGDESAAGGGGGGGGFTVLLYEDAEIDGEPAILAQVEALLSAAGGSGGAAANAGNGGGGPGSDGDDGQVIAICIKGW